MSSVLSQADYVPALFAAQTVFDMIATSLLVLDSEIRIVEASASFCRMTGATIGEVRGQPLFGLDDGRWDTPALRLALDDVVLRDGTVTAHEIERDLPDLGLRTLLLDARAIPGREAGSMFVTITDVTEQRATERRLEALIDQKGMLLEEMTHRVANSLTIIAGILILKARRVRDIEVRTFLEETHHRVISIATAQRLLRTSAADADVKLAPYLTELCESLATSMIGDRERIVIEVIAGDGAVRSQNAVSIGLIVTELVINALKYAFGPEVRHGHVTVTYAAEPGGWTLAVADDGIGSPVSANGSRPGLGTVIVEALATQLAAKVNVAISAKGRTTTLTHVAA